MEHLFGTTGRFLKVAGKKQNPFPVFFKPYKDKADFFYRAAAIITAPLIHAGLAVGSFFMALYNVFKALYQLIKGAVTHNAKQGAASARITINRAASLFGSALISGIAAFVAPAIETVDLIGSTVTTAIQASKHSKEPSLVFTL